MMQAGRSSHIVYEGEKGGRNQPSHEICFRIPMDISGARSHSWNKAPLLSAGRCPPEKTYLRCCGVILSQSSASICDLCSHFICIGKHAHGAFLRLSISARSSSLLKSSRGVDLLDGMTDTSTACADRRGWSSCTQESPSRTRRLFPPMPGPFSSPGAGSILDASPNGTPASVPLSLNGAKHKFFMCGTTPLDDLTWKNPYYNPRNNSMRPIEKDERLYSSEFSVDGNT
ncbi:uncharacterized protein EV420DRAFT_109706 [Desarmillaria tabescens]|uniref:Uncharacterized protein n=1 Tax=Armillaria tabescens TaxID=1929756 RepID=A0AA39NR99_ARMTA|nr:uncharacterized protein EV420DRAFT_109706 [Desarmillaria tabescens]KAK0470365.1 hypothetical protein EV420DRAFT_109706 [Desarmillaria tabescens]